ESGSGIDHTVTIESSGQFRLVFEAAYNYGLSKWYDLVNDPTASVDIAQNPTDYLPAHEQGALFNQCIQQGDVIGHVISAKLYNPGSPRSLHIIENTPARVIIEVVYHPMLGTTVNTNVEFTDTYAIYADGKIYLNHKIISLTDQVLGEWRNSIIGLGDPSYGVNSEIMTAVADNNGSPRTLTDLSKNWTPNQWAGFKVSLGYNHWAITGNTNNTLQVGAHIAGGGADYLVEGNYNINSRSDKLGWIRATNTQNPYTWSSAVAKYLFEYWDTSTPVPNTEWTKASILLVPKTNNPYQGKQSAHEWKGFKRWFYTYSPLNLTSGQEITQQYMMQLGTRGSTIQPDIISKTVADPYANDYLNPDILVMATGTFTGFDTEEGAYVITSSNNHAQFQINGNIFKRIKPVFKITGYNSTKTPQITVNGQPMAMGVDFAAGLASPGTLIVQLQSDISTTATISIAEGFEELPLPETDIQAPTTPTGLTAVATSPTQINIAWVASTDNNGVAGYLLHRDGTLVSSQTGTSYQDSGLTEGATYSYAVAAYDMTGNVTPQSTVATAKTQDTAPPVIVGRKSNAILDYNTNSSGGLLSWIKDRFSFKISGSNPGDSSIHWDTYYDIYGPGSIAELLLMKNWALTNGVKSEEMLLHAKVDYTSAIGMAWSQMDKFDNFEGANGVLRTADDVTYSDLTAT
ncbi:MAG: Chitosanase-glucanase, partial [uncultured bacterium]